MPGTLGQTPGSAADALVGLELQPEEPDRGSGADEASALQVRRVWFFLAET